MRALLVCLIVMVTTPLLGCGSGSVKPAAAEGGSGMTAAQARRELMATAKEDGRGLC